MRINQLYCRFGIGFAESASRKFNLRLTDNPDPYKPLFMIGCYNDHHLAVVNNHRSLLVLYWAGSDALNLKEWVKYKWWREVFNRPNIKHITASHWLKSDLENAGIESFSLPVSLVKLEEFNPVPLGKSVYMYKPESPIYNGGIYDKIKARIPFPVIEAVPTTYTKEDLKKVYADSFIALRFTVHDGLSETVAELGLMGRKVIHNGDLPNCIPHTKSVGDIVGQIYKAWDFKEDFDKVIQVSEATRKFLNIGEDWLNTEYYED